jgi:DNA-binding response OmpR family regulator
MKPRILIADDDTKLVTLLTSSLKKSGYDTSEAFDGEEALNQVKVQKPDLILADVVMPKLDGFELCKRIRADPGTEQIPFIFLTAKGELSDRVAGLSLGADDYIAKPFHISEVVARIKSILQRSVPGFSVQAEEGESDLKGNLEQMSMPELIQTLTMNKKSGELKIVKGIQVGKMFFDAGNIVQAALGKYKNEEAVYRILSWEEGYFEFGAADRVENLEMKATTNSLLMEGFQQRDEYLKYQEAMAPFDAIVRIINSEQVRELKQTSQKVVALIDGHRTIQDIINVSPVNYLVTVKVLYTLLKKNVIEAIETQQVKQDEDQDFSQLAHELYE